MIELLYVDSELSILVALFGLLQNVVSRVLTDDCVSDGTAVASDPSA